MKQNKEGDLTDVLRDAHAHFFMMKGEEVTRLKLWEIRKDSLVIELPVGAPMHRTMVGLVPTIDGSGVYEIDGTVESEELPDQMPGTFRLKVDPAGVRKVNRRLFPRFSFAPPIAATATPEGWERPVAGRLINLSAGGLRIETDEPLPADCAIAFRFDVESDDEIHSIARIGSIVYEVPMQSGFAYGVRFGRDEEDTISGEVEASVESLDKTADLLNLVNRLLVRR